MLDEIQFFPCKSIIGSDFIESMLHCKTNIQIHNVIRIFFLSFFYVEQFGINCLCSYAHIRFRFTQTLCSHWMKRMNVCVCVSSFIYTQRWITRLRVCINNLLHFDDFDVMNFFWWYFKWRFCLKRFVHTFMVYLLSITFKNYHWKSLWIVCSADWIMKFDFFFMQIHICEWFSLKIAAQMHWFVQPFVQTLVQSSNKKIFNAFIKFMLSIYELTLFICIHLHMHSYSNRWLVRCLKSTLLTCFSLLFYVEQNVWYSLAQQHFFADHMCRRYDRSKGMNVCALKNDVCMCVSPNRWMREMKMICF